MNTKLTLTIEENVIHKAKVYASATGDSLSNLVENYLKAVTKHAAISDKHELTPLVKSLKGSFTAPTDFDYKKELQKELAKKYNK